jgi:hypothetical protein
MRSGSTTEIKQLAHWSVAKLPEQFLDRVAFGAIVFLSVERIVLMRIGLLKYPAQWRTRCTAAQTSSSWSSVSATPEGK